MLQVDDRHLERFRQIKRLFYSKTEIPKENNWQSLTNNDIWLYVVAQVMVVGRSSPYEKFSKSAELKNEIAYETLAHIEDEEEIKRKINHVLLAVGTRYASSDISKCAKTRALVHNFKVLRTFESGPKGFFTKLSEFKGPDSDKTRIRYAMQSLAYIKSKGARDLLMELGLVKDAIALDARVQNVLQKVGIQTLRDFANTPKLYDQTEEDILTKICRPLGITGIEFDRVLYQNYEQIMKMR
jgi:hypothetical protein